MGGSHWTLEWEGDLQEVVSDEQELFPIGACFHHEQRCGAAENLDKEVHGHL